MSRLSSLRVLLCGLVLLIISTAAVGQVVISVGFGPPALPVYEQPICPGDGYIWTPGYWAWDGDYDDYYWVPGTWVLAPQVGYLWTPPWWGWDNGVYLFHEGWWGPTVGFYGGIAYGFGYFGEGFVGGRWEHDHFYYNRSVTNINVTNIRNVYNENVTVRNENHVSFNGGPGGLEVRPRAEDEAAARQRHIGPVAGQTQNLRAARGNPEFRATTNHGKPPVAATDRPGEFRGGGAVAARSAGGEYHPPANRGQGNRASENRAQENRVPENRGGAPENGGRPAVHPNDLPPMERPAGRNTGNAKQDQKYQKQQEKLYNKQNQERQRLQQRQEQEHQKMQARGNQQRQQQMEQRHQQQTQQMQERHAAQQQRMAPPQPQREGEAGSPRHR